MTRIIEVNELSFHVEHTVQTTFPCVYIKQQNTNIRTKIIGRRLSYCLDTHRHRHAFVLR